MPEKLNALECSALEYAIRCAADVSHGKGHLLRVLLSAGRLAAAYPRADESALRLACLLHDCAQAEQLADPSVHHASAGAEKARQRGSRLTPRNGWEDEKDGIMREILRQKFLRDPALQKKLLATGDLRLINGSNGKKDNYWSVNMYTWEGGNRLGILLMELRDQIRDSSSDPLDTRSS